MPPVLPGGPARAHPHPGVGLTRPGSPAAGLGEDFALQLGDIPPEPERSEPGRDLPPEIMAVLCAGLDVLGPADVRAATQIAIDTGRRPEDILGLPLDCLARDADGAPVLVYDNARRTGWAAACRSARPPPR